MKYLILILALSFILPNQSKGQAEFSPFTFDEMMKMARLQKEVRDQNIAKIDFLLDYISELKSKVSDQQFITNINQYANTLKSFYDTDLLGEYTHKIKQIENKLREDIDKYNEKIKTQNENLEANSRDQNNPEKYWLQGGDDLKNGNVRSAIDNLSKVIELQPDFPTPYLVRGICFYNLSFSAEALNDFDKYIELVGNDPETLHYRGWTYMRLNLPLNALKDFNAQLIVVPNSANAYYDRGSAKSELNDNYGAIQDYLKAIEIEPSFSMAYNNMGWSKFKLKKYTEALVDLDKSIVLDPKNSIAYDSRAEVKFNMEEYTGCIEDAEKAIELNPTMSNPYLLLGRSHLKMGFKDKACMEWSKAGELGKAEAYDFITKYCNN